jgi:hypothetical protein
MCEKKLVLAKTESLYQNAMKSKWGKSCKCELTMNTDAILACLILPECNVIHSFCTFVSECAFFCDLNQSCNNLLLCSLAQMGLPQPEQTQALTH